MPNFFFTLKYNKFDLSYDDLRDKYLEILEFMQSKGAILAEVKTEEAEGIPLHIHAIIELPKNITYTKYLKYYSDRNFHIKHIPITSADDCFRIQLYINKDGQKHTDLLPELKVRSLIKRSTAHLVNN